jgi:hypothetical protein
MAWNRRAEIMSLVAPDRVPATLADRLALTPAQMSLKIARLHVQQRLSDDQAASSIVIGSTCPPPIGGSRPSCR